MAEKLNRDRSTRKQLRTTSDNNMENQSSSRIRYSSTREESPHQRQTSVRKRDIQTHRSGLNYPPLEDYAE